MDVMKKAKFLIISSFILFLSCNQDEKLNYAEQMEICTTDLINSQNNSTSKPDAAIINWPRWQTGQTIKIKFLDGDITVHEKVKKYAGEWTNYANLKFEYVAENEDADIRIGFNIGNPGAWSELGMTSTYGVANHQSMRLGPLTSNNEPSVRRTVLHEFGHALGLIHETKNPAANIKWNLSKVYQYYNDLSGWSKEEVDEFVIKKSNSTNYSEYDPLSIMHYYVPASLTTDGKAVNEMSELSDIDKISINKWYPFPIVSVLESGQNLSDLPWSKRIKSPDGRYSLEFDHGKLKVIDSKENIAIWEVGDSSYIRKSNCFFESTTGNIIIKGAKSSMLPTSVTWTSNTTGFPGATLHLQDDGNLQLIYEGVVKWSSKEGKI